jgi:hypothetical protein
VAALVLNLLDELGALDLHGALRLVVHLFVLAGWLVLGAAALRGIWLDRRRRLAARRPS